MSRSYLTRSIPQSLFRLRVLHFGEDRRHNPWEHGYSFMAKSPAVLEGLLPDRTRSVSRIVSSILSIRRFAPVQR
jgi:hypothetical protein